MTCLIDLDYVDPAKLDQHRSNLNNFLSKRSKNQVPTLLINKVTGQPLEKYYENELVIRKYRI